MNVDEAIQKLNEYATEAAAAVLEADDERQVDLVRQKYLGRKSGVASINAGMRELSEEDRRKLGRVLNQIREQISSSLETREATLRESLSAAAAVAERIDVTLPGRMPQRGRIHPLTQVTDEIVDIFVGLGFKMAEGPIVESDWNNFEALNTPADHPARSMHDTFYLKTPGDGDPPLIRTHTSPMQVRIMESEPPPVFYVFPGRVARRDETTVNNLASFAQIEGLAVAHGITFADLRGTLRVFAREMFGKDLLVRMNPSYFPFTEPSAEVYVSCFVCDRAGCPTCRGEGWIEIMGAGMVHPNVFRAVGYDASITGFAFGMGIERIAKLKFGVPAIRAFYENDIRFLEAF